MLSLAYRTFLLRRKTPSISKEASAATVHPGCVVRCFQPHASTKLYPLFTAYLADYGLQSVDVSDITVRWMGACIISKDIGDHYAINLLKYHKTKKGEGVYVPPPPSIPTPLRDAVLRGSHRDRWQRSCLLCNDGRRRGACHHRKKKGARRKARLPPSMHMARWRPVAILPAISK